jgi:hypothetical protein
VQALIDEGEEDRLAEAENDDRCTDPDQGTAQARRGE